MTAKRRKRKPMTDKGKPEGWEHKHLQWLRGFECVAMREDPYGCDGRIIAHHVREGSHAGTARKPPDDRTVPLCDAHHKWLHDHGEKQFDRKHNMNLQELAASYARQSEPIKKWKHENP